MFFQTVTAVLCILPLQQALAAHSLLDPSDVLYVDELPENDAFTNDPDVASHKDIVYVRKDIDSLDSDNGPSLTCLPNGQVQLGFTGYSALQLDTLVNEQLIGHPIAIPHSYDDSQCPELTTHTLLGPKAYVPQDELAALGDNDFSIMLVLSEDEIVDNLLTLSITWVDYHEIIGVIGNAPPELAYLENGVYPWSDSTGSSSSNTTYAKRANTMHSKRTMRLKKRGFGSLLSGLFMALGPVFSKLASR